MGVGHTLGTAVVLAVALGFAGCASNGSRGGSQGVSRVATRGEGIAARLGDRAAASQSAAAFAERRTGQTALPRLARLNTDTPSLSEVEAASRPAPPPPGQYGPLGDSGIEPPPCWPPAPYYPGYPSYPFGAPGGYAVGGAVPYPIRHPHDPGCDPTGLAGAVHGASSYRNPGEDAGALHRPGMATGTGPFAKSLEAECRTEAPRTPPPSSHGHGRTDR